LGPTRLRKLDISNGCQDHTVLPSALAPLVCTPAHRSRGSARPATAIGARDAIASTASRTQRPWRSRYAPHVGTRRL